ncbi:hypothetical protein AVEN_29467-1, partial [Araneus ventricosus]
LILWIIKILDLTSVSSLVSVYQDTRN